MTIEIVKLLQIVAMLVTILTPIFLLWRKVERMEVRFHEQIRTHDQMITKLEHDVSEIKAMVSGVKDMARDTATNVSWIKEHIEKIK